MKRYLKVIITVDDFEDIDTVVDGLRTTIDRDQITTADGETFIEILSDEELVNECMCLGICFNELEELGIENAFYASIETRADEPIDYQGPEFLQ